MLQHSAAVCVVGHVQGQLFDHRNGELDELQREYFETLQQNITAMWVRCELAYTCFKFLQHTFEILCVVDGRENSMQNTRPVLILG